MENIRRRQGSGRRELAKNVEQGKGVEERRGK